MANEPPPPQQQQQHDQQRQHDQPPPQQQVQQQPLIPEHMRVEDQDAWLRRYGLPSGGTGIGGGDDGEGQQQEQQLCTLDQQEAQERVEQSQQYQDSILSRFFANDDAQEQERTIQKQQQLQSLQDGQIIFVMNQGHDVIGPFPLIPFAESCDTIFVLATTSPLLQQGMNDGSIYSSMDNKQEQEEQKQQKQQDQNLIKNKNHKLVYCHLSDYSKQDVANFCDCVLGIQQVEDLDDGSSDDDDDNNDDNNNKDKNCIVVCCCLADYLQHDVLRQATERILRNSIDTSNCLSLCQLADQLNMPTLFELSLRHMMQTLGSTTITTDKNNKNNNNGEDKDKEKQEKEDSNDNDDNNNNNNNNWQDVMTPELRKRIVMIQTAIQSSVHDSQHCKLYFHSLQEYISLFAERVQYFRERLAEAQEQFDIQTQQYYDNNKKNNKNNNHSSLHHRQDGTGTGYNNHYYSHNSQPYNNNKNDLIPGSQLWLDMKQKIDKQKQRVQTLSAVLTEQKKLLRQQQSQKQQKQQVEQQQPEI